MGLNSLNSLNDTEAVIDQGRAEGLSEAKLRASMAAIGPIIESLSFGEHPGYDALDRAALAALDPEIGYVARAFAASDKADIAGAGYQLLGLLDRPDDVPVLRAALDSSAQWERMEAIHALARMHQPEARAALVDAGEHVDPLTSRAALDAAREW